MAKGDRYRLNRPTLGVVSRAGTDITVKIPKNAIVELATSLRDDTRMVNVRWVDQTVMMFAQDIRQRGKLLKGGER
jgi:hypothetical protein